MLMSAGDPDDGGGANSTSAFALPRPRVAAARSVVWDLRNSAMLVLGACSDDFDPLPS